MAQGLLCLVDPPLPHTKTFGPTPFFSHWSRTGCRRVGGGAADDRSSTRIHSTTSG